ncbi:MAG: hypothetical protein SGJ21_10100 [Alphaproteobacteria bacterium]|nr:hypothetical protein [Alphaproteobacteria bacterium]
MLEETIAAEYPAWLDTLMWATVAIAAVWIVSSLFIWMRRRASNLTSMQNAGVQGDARPDFLSVDHKARKEAMARGEAYDDTLVAREKAAADAAAGIEAKKPVNMIARIAGLASLLFSVFSLFSAVMQVIMNMERMTGTLSRTDQLGMILQKYPIPVAICVFVIGFHIVNYFTSKKWTEAAR